MTKGNIVLICIGLALGVCLGAALLVLNRPAAPVMLTVKPTPLPVKARSSIVVSAAEAYDWDISNVKVTPKATYEDCLTAQIVGLNTDAYGIVSKKVDGEWVSRITGPHLTLGKEVISSAEECEIAWNMSSSQ